MLLKCFLFAWFVLCSCHNFLILVVFEIGCKGSALERNAQKNSLDKFDYQDYQKGQMTNYGLLCYNLCYLILVFLHIRIIDFHGFKCLIKHSCFSCAVARCIFYPRHKMLAITIAVNQF